MCSSEQKKINYVIKSLQNGLRSVLHTPLLTANFDGHDCSVVIYSNSRDLQELSEFLLIGICNKNAVVICNAPLSGFQRDKIKLYGDL